MNLKKNLERYLRIHLLGPGPRLMKKRIYRAVVSQRLRNTALEDGRNQNSDAWLHTNCRYIAIWRHCHLSTARTNCQSCDRYSGHDGGQPHRRPIHTVTFFVRVCTRLLTAIQFTAANRYATLRSALGRPKAVRLQTDPFQCFQKWCDLSSSTFGWSSGMRSAIPRLPRSLPEPP